MAGNGLIWRYFEDFRELEFFGSGSLFLVGGGTYQRGNFDSLVGKSDNGIVG